MLGPAFFLSGDTFPEDSYVESALAARIGPAFSSWIGQREICAWTGGREGWGDYAKRLAQFEQIAPTCGNLENAVLIGRSSGARVVTLYAHRRTAGAVVCLGYPFRPPNKEPEPDRYAHLARIGVPTLILQGLHDAYGGANIVADYPLSPNVTVQFLDTNHQFPLPPQTWDEIGRIVLGFCRRVFHGKSVGQAKVVDS
jgi:pimeloyl-ACP methyl ester carboxylesterase